MFYKEMILFKSLNFLGKCQRFAGTSSGMMVGVFSYLEFTNHTAIFLKIRICNNALLEKDGGYHSPFCETGRQLFL